MLLSDHAFIRQFEEKLLPPSEFNHLGHLRLAWLYINSYDVEQAIEKITVGIREYALSLGVTDKFHYTLTLAIVRIMKSRIDRQDASSFAQFLELNSDLVENMMSVIYTYYTEQRLNSKNARQCFIPPDIRSLPDS